MSGYVWTHFGVLVNVSTDDKMITITNETGSTRQMSNVKYKESAEAVYHKCRSLIGQSIDIRTSQNTAAWCPRVWFSDISQVVKNN